MYVCVETKSCLSMWFGFHSKKNAIVTILIWGHGTFYVVAVSKVKETALRVQRINCINESKEVLLWSGHANTSKEKMANLLFNTGAFPWQRPVTRSFDVCFLIWALNKQMSKQSWCWWYETPSRSLWRQCNVIWMRIHWIHHIIHIEWIVMYAYVNQLENVSLIIFNNFSSVRLIWFILVYLFCKHTHTYNSWYGVFITSQHVISRHTSISQDPS